MEVQPAQWHEAHGVLVEPVVVLDEEFLEPVDVDQGDASSCGICLGVAGEATRPGEDAPLAWRTDLLPLCSA